MGLTVITEKYLLWASAFVKGVFVMHFLPFPIFTTSLNPLYDSKDRKLVKEHDKLD